MPSVSTFKLLDQHGVSLLLLFVIFSLSFLASPYLRSKFDYSRSSWQRLLIASGCWLLLVYVVLLLFNSEFIEKTVNFFDYISFGVVGKLLANIFSKDWIDDHIYLYSAFHVALSYRVIFIIIRWYCIRYIFLRYQDHIKSKGRAKDYQLLLDSIGSPVDLSSWLRFPLDRQVIPYIKILQKADVPFQWIQLPLFKLSSLLDDVMEECEERFIKDEIKTLKELNWNKRKIMYQFRRLTHLQIFILSIGVEPKKSKEHFESMYGELPKGVINGNRGAGSRSGTLLEKLYKVKKALFRPLQEQRHAAITAQAVDNAADIMSQIYKSMEGRSTLEKYCNAHGVDPYFINDANNQQTMVSIHLRSGRIYCGWIIYSTRPGKSDTGLTMLPYVSKIRLNQGKKENKTEATKIVTNYNNLVWDAARQQIGGLQYEMVSHLLDTVKTLNDNYSKSLILAFEKYLNWVDKEYLSTIFRSDGQNYEVDQLLKIFPDEAAEFYKSFQLEDIEHIQFYNPSLTAADFVLN